MIYADVALSRYEAGLYTVQLTPPAPIGGRQILWALWKRFGSVQPLAQASIDSGIPNGASGLTILDSGQGIFSVDVLTVYSSGQPGNYAFQTELMDPPRTVLTRGYIILN